jgi:hypothetical protein
MPRPVRSWLPIVLLSGILILTGTGLVAYDRCAIEGLEGALHCSDVIVIGQVTETLSEGVPAGGSGIHTVHILSVEDYILGSGPKEIHLLTPGGEWTDSKGRRMFISIACGGAAWERAAVGDEIVAFLKKGSEGYTFVNNCWSRMVVQKNPESGARQVVIGFHKPEYLRGIALQKHEEAKKQLRSPNPEEVAWAGRKLAGVFMETISLSELPARIKSALAGEGGPKPANTICY